MRAHPPIAAFALLIACAAGGVSAQTPSTGSWPGTTQAQQASAPAPTTPNLPPPHRVELELHTVFGGAEAIAINPLAGPVQVQLVADGPAPISDPALPVRATVPAGDRVIVARLHDVAGGARLRLQAVPGPPDPRARDVTYLYPLREAPVRIAQGFGGGFSHSDAENRHAVDFAVTPGTPVLAARDGVVMQVESRATARLDPGVPADAEDDRVRGNFIRLLHDDGTTALYAHLQHGGVVVAPGARVLRGTIIGFSGNTGLSGGPHLHFVIQANRGMRLESLPFRMAGPDGPLRFGQAQIGTVPAAP